MIEHIGLGVTDYAKSKAFYLAALAPLGYKVIKEFAEWNVVGMGEAMPDFWISQKDKPGSAHVAFGAKTRADVDAFYKAAMAAGGKDNGAPGLRTDYTPTYYAAFITDPEGNNIEAVCHAAE